MLFSFPHVCREPDCRIILRQVCKDTDFFVLFAISARRVESYFYFSLFPRRDRCPVIVYGGAAAAGFDLFYNERTVACILKPERMAHFLACREFPEIPRFLHPFHLRVASALAALFFTASTCKQYAEQDSYAQTLVFPHFFLEY